jgi:hypothetical protein
MIWLPRQMPNTGSPASSMPSHRLDRVPGGGRIAGAVAEEEPRPG